MKLRIHADSIRLRLKQSEVKSLVEGKEVCETCPTLPVAFTYVLRPDPAASAIAAHSDGTRLTLRVPTAWLSGWDSDVRVGFESNDGALQFLIEKDWKCTNPTTPKDNEDCFENPEVCG